MGKHQFEICSFRLGYYTYCTYANKVHEALLGSKSCVSTVHLYGLTVIKGKGIPLSITELNLKLASVVTLYLTTLDLQTQASLFEYS